MFFLPRINCTYTFKRGNNISFIKLYGTTKQCKLLLCILCSIIIYIINISLKTSFGHFLIFLFSLGVRLGWTDTEAPQSRSPTDGQTPDGRTRLTTLKVKIWRRDARRPRCVNQSGPALRWAHINRKGVTRHLQSRKRRIVTKRRRAQCRSLLQGKNSLI